MNRTDITVMDAISGAVQRLSRPEDVHRSSVELIEILAKEAATTTQAGDDEKGIIATLALASLATIMLSAASNNETALSAIGMVGRKFSISKTPSYGKEGVA